ncbi:MAG: glycosyltransferase family 4 protein, partial [bacterium]|nr:glycosyltransferase family 4 protein [bacterium]
MKIGFLTNNTRMDNGWGRASQGLILALKDAGTDVCILVEEGGGLIGERVALARSQAHPFFLFASVLRVLPRLAQCDEIHAFDGYPYAIIGMLAAFLLRKKLIITLHGTYALDPFYNRSYIKRLYCLALKRADHIVTVSSYTRKTVEAAAGFAFLHSSVIPNGTGGFWLTSGNASHPAVRKPYILSVGMVKPQKGYAVSI